MMKLKKWELALLCAFMFSIAYCATPAIGQARLAAKITRLHVLANSDSAADQELKLHVRDAVLKVASVQSEKFDRADIDSEFLEKIRTAAQNEIYARGEHDLARVEHTKMYFTTRNYETFALPAGYYDAVRISIGKAEGHNWWCVMLPPLCEPASSTSMDKTAASAGITKEEIKYITKNGTKYRVKFKIAEIFGKISHALIGD